MKPILEIKNISKKFRIRHERQPYLSLRDSLSGLFSQNATTEDFWALNNISFNVEQGDTIGIVGKNGAGKSTLLKVLSKITPPSGGSITCRGRIASLLEVGTGFHPELSGRENVFLNGSILGMKRTEIIRNFDAIVDFAGVEKFIDTPLKHYSSGMQLRLAFAVAAFLENEILIIDEVLAVGDAEFQRKCMGKMDDVSKSGRTILFVSHNMASLQAVCKKGLYIEKGKAEGIAPVEAAVKRYTYGLTESNQSVLTVTNINKTKEAYITGARVLDTAGGSSSRFRTYDDIQIEISWVNRSGGKVNPNIMLVNSKNQTVMVSIDTTADWYGDKKSKPGKYISYFRIPKNLLNVDDYMLNIALDCSSPAHCYDAHFTALMFSVWDPMDEHSIARGNFSVVREDAVLMPALECSFKYVEENIS